MFVTDSRSEVVPPEPLAAEGLRIWGSIELGLELPWFVATFEYQGEEGRYVRTFFTTSLEDLKPDASKEPGWGALLDVQLVTPSWTNRSGGWRMDDLREVRAGYSLGLGREVLVFVLDDGRCFAETGVVIEQLTDQKSLFKFLRPRAPARTH